nr:unnamed protein product [Digitaria exilis]
MLLHRRLWRDVARGGAATPSLALLCAAAGCSDSSLNAASAAVTAQDVAAEESLGANPSSDWRGGAAWYGFSKEIVECPGYWPSSAHACGFCMGFLRNPKAFLMVLKAAIESTDYRFILFSSGYQPLDSAIQSIASSVTNASEASSLGDDNALLFNRRLFCFSGSIPYSWLFPRCAAAIHHAGSGSTAAALRAGIPQVLCPFLLDQFYWAERLHWLGVAPEPLQRQHLIPDNDDALSIHNAADVLLGAIRSVLLPEIKDQATIIANRLSFEDGIGEALRILKERVLIDDKI